jgi:hypothetical protein
VGEVEGGGREREGEREGEGGREGGTRSPVRAILLPAQMNGALGSIGTVQKKSNWQNVTSIIHTEISCNIHVRQCVEAYNFDVYNTHAHTHTRTHTHTPT